MAKKLAPQNCNNKMKKKAQMWLSSSYRKIENSRTIKYRAGEKLRTFDTNTLARDIEFSNNGVSDSLTGAPAPKIFFDNLARDISQSRRKSQAISIITMKLLPEKSIIKEGKEVKEKIEIEKVETLASQSSNTSRAGITNKVGITNLEFEKGLVIISNCIKNNMRGSDFYSRLAENGFWLCLQGDLEEAARAAERFEAKISQKFTDLEGRARIEFDTSEWKENLDANNWIHEIDQQYFEKA
ncbi:MAG: hypothetical protein QNL32_06305 [Actinomycetes bacterium]